MNMQIRMALNLAFLSWGVLGLKACTTTPNFRFVLEAEQP